MSREQALAALNKRIQAAAITLGVDPGAYFVIPASGGPALQNLSLMTNANRLVCVGAEDIVIVGTSMQYRKAKGILWRGPCRDVKARSWFGHRQITFKVPGRILRRRVQIDGLKNCERFLREFERCRSRGT